MAAGGSAVVTAQLQEAAEVWSDQGKRGDSYASTYKVRGGASWYKGKETVGSSGLQSGSKVTCCPCFPTCSGRLQHSSNPGCVQSHTRAWHTVFFSGLPAAAPAVGVQVEYTMVQHPNGSWRIASSVVLGR